jgi:aryl-alcohol dehydrogenase-like predicted oxidoreductase
MRMRKLGPEGPSVSVIGLGGMLLSITGRPPDDQALRVLDSALDSGVTLFDTADAYCLDDSELGHNERLLARGLEGQRDKVTVMTTVGLRRPGGAWTVDSSPEYLVECVERSLKNQAVAALDVVMLYSADLRVPYEESVGTLFRLKEQGKVKQVGICNADLALIKRADSVGPIQVIENRWHPLAREIEKNGVIEHCSQTGKALVAYCPFGGTLGAPTLTTLGKLSDQARRRRLSPYQLVLGWMINKAPTGFVVAGARRSESIEDSAGAGAVEFDSDAIRAVENTIPANAA